MSKLPSTSIQKSPLSSNQTQLMQPSSDPEKEKKHRSPRAARADLRLNAIPLKKPAGTLPLRLGLRPESGAYPIATKALSKAPESVANGYMYSDFKPPQAPAHPAYTFEGEVRLDEAPEVCRHYYLEQLRRYFAGLEGVLLYYNFIHQLEVWLPADIENGAPHAELKTYDKLMFWICTHGAYPLLWISYAGRSYVHRHPLDENPAFAQADRYVCKGYVLSKLKLEEARRHERYDPRQTPVYPVMNRMLWEQPGLNHPYEKKQNPLKDHVSRITQMKDDILTAPAFKEAFPYLDKRRVNSREEPVFERINSSDTINIESYHQYAYMGQKHVHKTAGHYATSFMKHGPYRSISHTRVKVCLLAPVQAAPDALQEIRNRLLPTLQKSMGTGFHAGHSLSYSPDAQASAEIREQLNRLIQEGYYPDLIICLLPYHKYEPDAEKRRFYDRLKAVFREYQLPSQCIYQGLPLDQKKFQYSLPGLSVKICAKLGGIPWRSYYGKNKRSPSLMIGINACKDTKMHKAYMASMSFFMEDALIMENTGLQEHNPKLLASAIRKAIRRYHKQHQEAGRIVIHLHKRLNHKENKQIIQAIEELGSKIKVYFVMLKASPHRLQFFWDDSKEDKLPQSGRALHLPDGSYLLSINRRLERKDRPDFYPFPIRLKIWAAGPEEHSGKIVYQQPQKEEIKALLAQIVRMSVNSWRSVRPAITPASVSYPKTLARRYRDFPNGFNIVGQNQLFEGI